MLKKARGKTLQLARQNASAYHFSGSRKSDGHAESFCNGASGPLGGQAALLFSTPAGTQFSTPAIGSAEQRPNDRLRPSSTSF